MLTFVIRRMIATVFVVFTITVLVFLIFFHTPGVDPARKLAGRNPSPETIKAIKHQYGLDRPLPVQYVILMKKLFITRDLTSYSNQGQKVVPEIEMLRLDRQATEMRGQLAEAQSKIANIVASFRSQADEDLAKSRGDLAVLDENIKSAQDRVRRTDLKAPVLGLYGGKDTGIPAEAVEKMKKAVANAKKPSEIVVYPDAQHGFHADYRSSYNKESAEDGWKRLLAWFKKNGVA